MFLNPTDKVTFKGEMDINSSEYGAEATVGADGLNLGLGAEYVLGSASGSVERDSYYAKSEIGAELKIGIGASGDLNVGSDGVRLKLSVAFLVGIEIDVKIDFKFENWFRG